MNATTLLANVTRLLNRLGFRARSLVIAVPFWWLFVFFLIPFAVVAKISFSEAIIARTTERRRSVLLMLIILPFWTSFLLRVYAWIGILKTNGIINNILMSVGITSEPIIMMQANFAVYVGIVYTYLPFMILPLFINLVKLDPSLLKASADLGAAWISLKIAFVSASLATVLGTLAAFVLGWFRKFHGKNLLNSMISAPLVMPDVIIGLSLLLLFIAMESIFGWPAGRGLTTIIISHTTFAMAYVASVVQSRLVDMDGSLEEATLDLGAKPVRVFFDITLPVISPALVSGWLLSFTLSLDDLVIASFVSGPGASTLPMVIFSKVRLGVSADINALAIIVIVAIGVVIASLQMKPRKTS